MRPQGQAVSQKPTHSYLHLPRRHPSSSSPSMFSGLPQGLDRRQKSKACILPRSICSGPQCPRVVGGLASPTRSRALMAPLSGSLSPSGILAL